MTPFEEDTLAIFDGPLAVDAEWLPGGVSGGLMIRVIPGQADDIGSFGLSRVRTQTAIFRIPVSTVPAVARGDQLVIADVTYTIQGAPLRDARHLWWTAEAVQQ